MLFLVRTVFWLSIVFWSISWPRDPDARARAPGVPGAVQDILGEAQAAAKKACSRAPTACLEGAAHLSRMVGAHRSGGKDKTPPPSPVVDAPAASHDYIKRRPPDGNRARGMALE